MVRTLELSGRRRTCSMSSTRRTSSSSSSCMQDGKIRSTSIGNHTLRMRQDPILVVVVPRRNIPLRNSERERRGLMPMATPMTTTTTSLRHREQRARRFRQLTEIQGWVPISSVGLRNNTITGTRCTTVPSGSILPVAWPVLKSVMSTRWQSHLPLRNGRKLKPRAQTLFAPRQPPTPRHGTVRNSLIRRMMKICSTSICP